MLNKYPVYGKLNEYRVDITDESISLGIHYWRVKVYMYDPNRLLFKYKKVYVYEIGWNTYKDYIGKYVELASKVVNLYENAIIEDQEEELAHQRGLKEFDLWDGKIN